jgi:hypothetical protein
MSGPSDDGSGPSLSQFTGMETPVKSPPALAEQEDSNTPLSVNNEGQAKGPDVFDRRGSADSGTASDRQADEGFVLSRSLQDPSEELPIELISLADR